MGQPTTNELTLAEHLAGVLAFGGPARVWDVPESATIRWGLDGLVISHWSED